MNQPIHYLFSMGLARRGKVENVVQVLKDLDIQCVVDVREKQNAEGLFGQNNLKRQMKEAGMIYMSFLDEFGKVEERTRRQNGKVNYEKACKDEWFKRGIQRLQEGLQKGYRMVLLGLEAEPQESFRYLVIGRRLEELGIQVWHILSNNKKVTQSALNEHHRQQHERTKMWSDNAAEVGKMGEDIAETYLKDHGFGILDRNWNLHKGCEIDIVAHRNGMVHFVEVKTRNEAEYANPEYAINQEKLQHLIKAAKAYKEQHLKSDIKCWIDSIAVILKEGEKPDITFHENICNLGII